MTEITNRMDDRALRSVDAIQVENSWMYNYARQPNEGRAVELRYFPPGLDVRTLCPAMARELTRDPYILCVGRREYPRKNIGLMLEAYALIPNGVRSRLRLLLAGQAGPSNAFLATGRGPGPSEPNKPHRKPLPRRFGWTVSAGKCVRAALRRGRAGYGASRSQATCLT